MTTDNTPLPGLPLDVLHPNEPITETTPPSEHRRPRVTTKGVISQVLLTLVLLAFMTPFIWMIATSLKPGGEVFSRPPSLIGSSLRLQNYVDAWTYVPFGRFMFNGLVVSVLGTALVCLTSLLAAYALSRMRFRGREPIFAVYLITLMVPQEVLIVPMFIFMQQLGWINSYQALILPWAFTAFGVFLLRQFMRSIPLELEEAAKVDGASRMRVLFTIILPIARPAVAVLAVFTFIGYWNSFLWPLIVTNTLDMSTVPVGLNAFLGQQGNQWHLLMAASAISMLPTALLVLFLQKHLVKGIAMSGMGGS